MGNDVAEGSVTLGPCDNAYAGGVWEKCTTYCSSGMGYTCYETIETEIEGGEAADQREEESGGAEVGHLHGPRPQRHRAGAHRCIFLLN